MTCSQEASLVTDAQHTGSPWPQTSAMPASERSKPFGRQPGQVSLRIMRWQPLGPHTCRGVAQGISSAFAQLTATMVGSSDE